MARPKFQPSASERRKYVLSTKRDLLILELCKKLEKKKLLSSDRRLVRFLKTQLESDWRKPLIAELRRLETKYS